MNQVLKKVDELIDVLNLRIRAAEERERVADLKFTRVDDQAKEQARRELVIQGQEKKLAEREQRVSKIENILAEEQRIANANASLVKQTEEFQKLRKATEEDLKVRDEALKHRAKKLADGEQQLEADRKSYKADTLRSFADKGWIVAPAANL